ncbi:MAG: oligosaccharide flippase family protein [Flavobacteriales bacterium]|nr:oligosaccharide flippase family protein [Flavobacteriales bacterium]MCW8913598.1 oligosaccharide flippase family protein [Flavobacteriales bacterium]MCW8938667.1 oligosaccharide flippase family protein [Flavobacteriales bacterium]MCW8967846.1 oligosaccharide flippase family protein [Flavobacteriales bacterium]MCW8990671.1 oligosaccharide flippase family protein [Flavobacteriales bacterium]
MIKFPTFIARSEFSKHVTTLIVGQIIVHAIAFLALPIITKLYSAEQIGAYSLFMALFMVLSMLSTGRYDAAIVIEKEEKATIALWSLATFISFWFNVLLFIFIYFFHETILAWLNKSSMGIFILLLPLAIFFGGLIRTTQYYFNKHKGYKTISSSDILKSGINSTGSVTFGWLGYLSGGLIIANVLSSVVAFVFLAIKLPVSFWRIVKSTTFIDLKDIGKKYKNYLTFYTLSGILSAIVSNGTPIFIIFFFTEKTAGYYFMAEKVVSIPIGLLVAAISRVFYQRASELFHHDKKGFLSLIYRIQKKMFWALIPLLILLSLAAPYAFDWFGNDWRQAGEMIKYFAILVLFNNLVSPVGSISNIIDRLDILLYFNITTTIIRALTFYIGSLYFSFEHALLISAICLSICYIALDFILKKLVKKMIAEK